ncbi:MAG: phenylalanine--tRNA ligase subunit alpha, partial [Deltaproteobacteria bacterium]|nr:phenylalanine--tRNA ligase subunit alpha [Deltaproteobacteria bacterium]
MKEQLLALEKRALEELSGIDTASALEKFRVTYLGKKGLLTGYMKKLGDLPPRERPEAGKMTNLVKGNLTRRFQEAQGRFSSKKTPKPSLMDVTLPGREPLRGHLHPITSVTREACLIFSRMGFRVVKGPNVELDYYNFEALNFPKDHPARDMQDTLYISENIVLRTHTSPMQVRVMEAQRPPVSVIAPGKV